MLDQGLGLITSVWMPWSGKRFDSAANRATTCSPQRPLAGEAARPRYATKEIEGGRAAFDFETRIEPGKQDPETKVLVIDDAPVTDNPDLLIRKIRDELVEIAGGAHLGKILYRTGDDSYGTSASSRFVRPELGRDSAEGSSTTTGIWRSVRRWYAS